ncbi:transcriptional regulator, XRE family [Ketogulonicigenium robustum]|uniref:Transcriptional regulator, XRE family n=1 Tax=Ketogulonicigenium robustum TaxID=92947 RepID=A0A1W6P178_9RHOB|nr:transcriptional regulator, XRE family [Ketogulonicigenium robustum]
MIGMTQQQLAEHVGIKFQQIQKYETGANRVSASRLWEIAHALGTSISYFYEGMSDAAVDEHPVDEELWGREAMELLRSYYAIPEEQRRHIFELARVLSDAA